MPSLKARAVVFLLKHRHWFRLKARRESITFDTSIPALRAQVEKSGVIFGKLPPDIAVDSFNLGSMSLEWIRPRDDAGGSAMLYFHGGGYVMGSHRSHRAAVAKFVAGSGVPALVFDYRLAPEHPFPAALDDALAAWEWLLARGQDPARAVFAGDSAGGGLLLAALLALRDKGRPLPAAAVALSPWTDLTSSGPSYQESDPLAPDGCWEVFSRYYAGERDRREPLISPLFGDLQGLPPLLLHAGGAEIMRDDAISFAAKARAAGVEVRLELGEGMFHCYPAVAPLFPEATAALADCCAFIRQHARG